MRNDPPDAPFMVEARRDLISKSFGCFTFNPIYLFDVSVPETHPRRFWRDRG
jgi:hypothetical protein